MPRRRQIIRRRTNPFDPGCELTWSVHLARDAPERAALVVLAAAASGLLCFKLFGSLLYGLFCIVALLAATCEFLLPIRYRMDADGVEMRNLHNWRRISWGDVRKAYVLEDGVKLSPLAHGGPREAFRGVFVRWGDQREGVMDRVRRELEKRGNAPADV